MRFFLVVIIWIVIVGGLWNYISNRDARRELIVASIPVDMTVEGSFAVEITPTFSTEEDPFALTSGDNSEAPFEVRLNGMALDIAFTQLQRGETIRRDDVTGVLDGHNAIYVMASPPMSESAMEHGIRIKFYQDNIPLVDTTVWADQGALVSGTISFNYTQNEEAGHDH